MLIFETYTLVLQLVVSQTNSLKIGNVTSMTVINNI